jgi:uncharacterized membrane protein
MIRTFAPLWSAAWRLVIMLLIVEIAVVSALRYVIGSETPPTPITANPFAHPFLVIHVVAAMIALLVGPLQFVRRLRTRFPAFHRATGKLYVAAILIGSPAGFVLALGSTAGPLAASGFATVAVLSIAFTWLGWRAAVNRQFAGHREWMLRSWAMTSAAITLRLYLPAAGMLGLGFYTAYPVIAWLSWLTNLAIVEYWIRRTRTGRPAPARLATA